MLSKGPFGFAFPLTAFFGAISSRLLTKRKEHYEIEQLDARRGRRFGAASERVRQ
jgi:hypothetical protein